MSFYQQLIAATAAEREYLLAAPAIQACQRGEVTLPRYIAFLTEAYYHVRQTVPLLMACGSRLTERHRWLQDAITEYIEEERGHDRWILNDIAACGGDRDAVAAGEPNFYTEMMVSYAWDSVMPGNFSLSCGDGTLLLQGDQFSQRNVWAPFYPLLQIFPE